MVEELYAKYLHILFKMVASDDDLLSDRHADSIREPVEGFILNCAICKTTKRE